MVRVICFQCLVTNLFNMSEPILINPSSLMERERGFAPPGAPSPFMLAPVIPSNVFNVQKSSYRKPSLFLGEQPGLFDTINRHYPEIWKLYKTLKKQDWDELELPLDSLNAEFKAATKADYDIMIRTLAWQWEADSTAAQNILYLMTPFLSSSELFAMYAEITRNEIVHAATYSEIVRASFDNPEEVMADILAVKESLQRMEAVAKVFDRAGKIGRQIMDGTLSRDSDEAYDALFMMLAALYSLERIQFMVSFGVTFCYGAAKRFLPAAKNVQKIALDEFGSHAEVGRLVIGYELETERGQRALARNRDAVKELIDSVCSNELTFIDFLFEDGRELTGGDKYSFQRSVKYHSAPVYQIFGFEVLDVPARNPLSFVDEWLNLSEMQIAPQEEKGGAYFLGGVVVDHHDINFESV